MSKVFEYHKDAFVVISKISSFGKNEDTPYWFSIGGGDFEMYEISKDYAEAFEAMILQNFDIDLKKRKK